MLWKHWRRGAILGLCLAARAACAQQPSVVGEAFRVNSVTAGTQAQPAVCSDPDGNFVVAWDSILPDSFAGTVSARRFDAEGNPRGSEFLVSLPATVALDEQPDVACAQDGGFVVVWSSSTNVLGTNRVMARQFNSAGDPRAEEFLVSTAARGQVASPAVAINASAEFLVVFIDGGRLRGIRFDRNGNHIGTDLLISSNLNAHAPSVQFDSDGRALVVWQQDIPESVFLSGVFGQRFDGFGLPLGDAFRVKQVRDSDITLPQASFARSGEFVVAWSEVYDDGGIGGPVSNGVHARRYTSQGQPQAAELLVSDSSEDYSPQIGLGGSDSGHFLVVWIDQADDSSDVFGRFFDSLGASQGSEFRVSQSSNGVTGVGASRLTDGQMLVVWTDSPEPFGPSDVFARRVRAPVPTAPPTATPTPEDEGSGCGSVRAGAPSGPGPGSTLLALAVGLVLISAGRRRWLRGA